MLAKDVNICYHSTARPALLICSLICSWLAHLLEKQPYHCETCAADFAEFQHHALSPAKQQSLNMFFTAALCTILTSQHTAFRLTGNAVCIRVLATSRGSTHAHMNMPESPPQVTADAESVSVARMPGSGLFGAVLPGNVRRRACRCQQVIIHGCGCIQHVGVRDLSPQC